MFQARSKAQTVSVGMILAHSAGLNDPNYIEYAPGVAPRATYPALLKFMWVPKSAERAPRRPNAWVFVTVEVDKAARTETPPIIRLLRPDEEAANRAHDDVTEKGENGGAKIDHSAAV